MALRGESADCGVAGGPDMSGPYSAASISKSPEDLASRALTRPHQKRAAAPHDGSKGLGYMRAIEFRPAKVPRCPSLPDSSDPKNRWHRLPGNPVWPSQQDGNAIRK